MSPGAAPHRQIQTQFATEQGEITKASLARKIKLAFDLLVVNPKNVGCHDIDPGRLHFEQFIPPTGPVIT